MADLQSAEPTTLLNPSVFSKNLAEAAEVESAYRYRRPVSNRMVYHSPHASKIYWLLWQDTSSTLFPAVLPSCSPLTTGLFQYIPDGNRGNHNNHVLAGPGGYAPPNAARQAAILLLNYDPGF